MSYILDALRRAESDRERERGSVPTIHTRQDEPIATPGASRGIDPLVWVIVGLALALIGSLAWTLLGSPPDPAPSEARLDPDKAPTARPLPAPPVPVADEAPPARSPARPPTATTVAAQVPPPPVTPQVSDLPARRDGPPSDPPSLAPPPPPAPATTAPPKFAPTRPSMGPAEPDAGGPAADATPAPVSTPPARAAGPAPAAARTTGLPALAIGGSRYSEDPAQRILIIDGQVVREGGRVSPDLTVEEIRLKSAVLNYRGQRYTVSY